MKQTGFHMEEIAAASAILEKYAQLKVVAVDTGRPTPSTSSMHRWRSLKRSSRLRRSWRLPYKPHSAVTGLCAWRERGRWRRAAICASGRSTS